MRNFNQLFGSSSGGVMVGSPVMLPDSTPPLLERNGQVYAMSGTLITDPTKYDPDVFTVPHFPAATPVPYSGQVNPPSNMVVDGVFYRIYVSGSTYKLQKSTDGITFTDVTVPNLSAFTRLAKMDGLWIIGGAWTYGITAYYWTSTDGVTWTRRTSPWSLTLNSTTTASAAPVTPLFAFNGRLYVSTMRNGSGDNGELYSTADGITFRKETMPSNITFSSVNASQSWVDGSRIAVAQISRSSVTPARNDYIYTLDGSTWQLITYPASMAGLFTPAAAPGFASAIGFVNGQFEIFDYVRDSTGVVTGYPAIYRSANMQTWTTEVVPTNSMYLLSLGSFYLTDEQTSQSQLLPQLKYVAGWYWLSSTFEKGKIYISKDAKTWIKRTVIPTGQHFYPSAPVASGNKLLFTDANVGNGQSVMNCLLEFDQSIKAAGSSERYVEGNFVQFVRTL